jgi:hypothetical protein
MNGTTIVPTLLMNAPAHRSQKPAPSLLRGVGVVGLASDLANSGRQREMHCHCESDQLSADRDEPLHRQRHPSAGGADREPAPIAVSPNNALTPPDCIAIPPQERRPARRASLASMPPSVPRATARTQASDE